MRLGVSSHTFVWAVGVSGFPQPARPLTAAGLLVRAAELGVGVVQIADNLPLDRLPPTEIRQLRQQADRLGLDLEIGTCGIGEEHLQTYLRLAMELRSPLLRVVIDTDSEQPAVEEVVQRLRQVLPEFERAGITLAIENHNRFPAATLAAILQRCESPRVGVCLDTANSLGCGEDIHTVLRSLGPWVVNLHVKDFQVRRLPHKKGFVVEGCPAGSGQLDIAGLLSHSFNPQPEAQARRADAVAAGSGLNEMSAILELWPPPEATIEESISKEAAWTRQSIGYLRRFVKR